MAEYRPVPDDREADFRSIARYAFDAQSGPYDPEDGIDERRERMFSFGEERGLFEGDDLLVVCKHIPFTARVRGEWLPMGGLSAVASPPQNRREGLVGELLAESLSEYRDREWPISALYPFDEAFYARYGWATGCRYQSATVDVEALAETRDAAAGSFRRVAPDDHEQLEPVYEAWLDGVDLVLDRTDDWWRDHVFQSYESALFGALWERDDEPRGYLVYAIEDRDDGRALKTYEFAAVDHEAYLNLLRFCYNHDSQVSTVELYGPDHERLLDVVDDRGAVDLEVGSGAMVRIVDVPMALEAVEYPGADDDNLVLAVRDDHAPWNEANFAVTVADGTASVAETDAEPDATVDVGTLSQLFVGHHGVQHARMLGDLEVADERAAGTLAAMFPESDPFLSEGF